jgi:hypothetical protein
MIPLMLGIAESGGVGSGAEVRCTGEGEVTWMGETRLEEEFDWTSWEGWDDLERQRRESFD